MRRRVRCWRWRWVVAMAAGRPARSKSRATPNSRTGCKKLARDYKPDFEAAFAGVFGDVAGTAIARALHDAARWTGDGARHFRDDAVDWLRDEARLTVPPSEMNAFLDDVDALRERAERLAVRVARLGDRRP
jgi:Uncharacterized protein conserved in bacteria